MRRPENRDAVISALRIRAVESALYDAFGKGQLHGTIHTCIGQEFSGVAICRKLQSDDFVTSNHRCHGHFIATTGQWRGLIDELVGNVDGVCAGIGSSQHLCDERFISNGQQGGLLPVAAGVALDRKLAGKKAVVVSFIGEGTLGEGVLYETANITNLWNLPHLIVCENNGYSQSTPQFLSVAGDIGARAEAFGARVFKADTWDLETLNETAAQALEYVRGSSRPALMIVQTYRLNPHSKGDDQRAQEEIKWFSDRDPVNVAIREIEDFSEAYAGIAAEVSSYLATAIPKPKLALSDYRIDQLPRADGPLEWKRCEPLSGGRGAQQLNEFYGDWLESDTRAVFLGEDIADPYGGAFKVSKGFTTRFRGAGRDHADQRGRDHRRRDRFGSGGTPRLRRDHVRRFHHPRLRPDRQQRVQIFSHVQPEAQLPGHRAGADGGASRLWSDAFPIARALSAGHRQLLPDQPEFADSARLAARGAEVPELSGDRRGEQDRLYAARFRARSGFRDRCRQRIVSDRAE